MTKTIAFDATAAFIFLLLASVSAPALAADFTVVPSPRAIYSHHQAQQRCPGACESRDGIWNGNWWTTIWGEESVCSCTPPPDEFDLRACVDVVSTVPLSLYEERQTDEGYVCEGGTWNVTSTDSSGDLRYKTYHLIVKQNIEPEATVVIIMVNDTGCTARKSTALDGWTGNLWHWGIPPQNVDGYDVFANLDQGEQARLTAEYGSRAEAEKKCSTFNHPNLRSVTLESVENPPPIDDPWGDWW